MKKLLTSLLVVTMLLVSLGGGACVFGFPFISHPGGLRRPIHPAFAYLCVL